MKHAEVRGSVALVLAVALAMVASVSAQTKRALVIGINTYIPQGAKAPEVSSPGVLIKPGAKLPADLPKGRGSWSNLRGSVNDAEAIMALLPRFGFKPENVHLLCDRTTMESGDHKLCEAEATREGILGAIRRYLIDASKEGDVAFFYYAGHGSQMKNSKSRERDGYDESIVPADSIKGALDIRDKEFARLFNQVVDKKAALTAIYDSCHTDRSPAALLCGRNRPWRSMPRILAKFCWMRRASQLLMRKRVSQNSGRLQNSVVP